MTKPETLSEFIRWCSERYPANRRQLIFWDHGDGSVSGYGWYYTDWLTKLSEDPSMPTLEIGRQIADDFVRFCAQKGQGSSTTLSLVDLAELECTAPEPFAAFSQSASCLIQEKEYKSVYGSLSSALLE